MFSTKPLSESMQIYCQSQIYFSEIAIWIHKFSAKKMHLKMLSCKTLASLFQPQYVNLLKNNWITFFCKKWFSFQNTFKIFLFDEIDFESATVLSMQYTMWPWISRCLWVKCSHLCTHGVHWPYFLLLFFCSHEFIWHYRRLYINPCFISLIFISRFNSSRQCDAYMWQ